MKLARTMLSSVMCLSLVGCGGVKFGNVPDWNIGLPDDFRNRILYENTDILKYSLDQLVGHVVYKDPDSAFVLKHRILVVNFTPVVTALDPATSQLYRSKIDRGAAAQGSYLVFAANLSESQAAEITIQDVAVSLVPSEKIPNTLLVAEANKPKPNPKTKRYWIQGVLLATIAKAFYNQIDASASGVVGNTFGIGGKVYNNQSAANKDYKISLLLVDIDDYGTNFVKLRTPSDFDKNAHLVRPAMFLIHNLDGLKEQLK